MLIKKFYNISFENLFSPEYFFALSHAKYFETEVSGVCGSSNLDLVKYLGADFVIDYTKENFTKSNKKYDIIFDTVCNSEKEIIVLD